MNLFGWLIFTGFLVFAGGCAQVTLLPGADQPGEIDLQNKIITKKVGGVRVSIQTHEWRYYPTDLEQAYTPFLFLVKNETGKSIDLSQKNIALVYANGEQFMPVSPREIEKGYYDPGMGMTSSGYFGFGSGGRSSYFGMGLEFPIGGTPPLLPDVSRLALPEGGLVPGAIMRGFVYFRKIPPEVSSVTLHVEFNQVGEDFHFIQKR